MVSGGESSGYPVLRVREQLWMFSQLYGMESRVARRRIDELLERSASPRPPAGRPST